MYCFLRVASYYTEQEIGNASNIPDIIPEDATNLEIDVKKVNACLTNKPLLEQRDVSQTSSETGKTAHTRTMLTVKLRFR